MFFENCRKSVEIAFVRDWKNCNRVLCKRYVNTIIERDQWRASLTFQPLSDKIGQDQTGSDKIRQDHGPILAERVSDLRNNMQMYYTGNLKYIIVII